jgi:hypothetical protein
MKRFLAVILMVCAPALGENPRACAQPEWTVDLAKTYGFRSFGMEHLKDAPHPQGWIQSRGVTFLSPDLIAIYQVLPSGAPPSLADRNLNTSKGSFVLQIEVLASSDGKPVKSLSLPTSSGVDQISSKWEWTSLFSSVLPTHDGRFLVRTKGLLHVFSRDFMEIASRPLPQSGIGSHDSWEFSISPDGGKLYAEHHENTGYDDNQPFKMTCDLMDADTLQVIRNWDCSEGHSRCPWGPEYKTEGGDSGKGPNKIVVMPGQGHPSVTITLPGKDRSASAQLSNSLLAVQIHHYGPDPFDLGGCSKPVRLAIYDLALRSEKCSIPIGKEAGHCGSGFLYSVSSSGDVAVIQGTQLSFYLESK